MTEKSMRTISVTTNITTTEFQPLLSSSAESSFSNIVISTPNDQTVIHAEEIKKKLYKKYETINLENFQENFKNQ